MRYQLLGCHYLDVDETTVQVLREPDRGIGSLYMAVRDLPARDARSDYKYQPIQSDMAVREFLAGWSDYLTTDGYGLNFNMGISGVTNTASMVHTRRKFAEIVRVTSGDADCERTDSLTLEVRRHISRILRVDSRSDGMLPYEWREAMSREPRPYVKSSRAGSEGTIAKAMTGILLHGALAYALRFWSYVTDVPEDGRLGLDNNTAEQAIKPFVIGRKNWLFSNTPRGAEAFAAIY